MTHSPGIAHTISAAISSIFRDETQLRRKLHVLLMLMTGSSLATQVLAQQTGRDDNAPSVEIQKVEVRATKPIQNFAGRTSLSGEEISRIPGAGGDPMKAIQTLPGIVVANDASGEPAVRGARPSDNAYYVDLLPVGYLFHSGGLVSVLNADLIRRFDIHSAAWSPEYGDVLGGVFDVSLRNPRSDRIGGKASMSFLNSSVLLEGPLTENTSFFFAARRSWIDIFVKELKDEKEGITFTVPAYSDVQGRYLWSINSKNRLRIDANTANDRINFTLKSDSKIGQQEPVLVGNSAFRQSFSNLATVLESDISPQTSNQLAVGRMVNRAAQRIGSAGSVGVTVTSTYLRDQLTTTIGNTHGLTMGVDVNSDLGDVDVNIKDPRCTEFDPNCDFSGAQFSTIKKTVREDQYSAYINDRWTFMPDWTLTGGLRATRDAYLKQDAVDPRIGLEWNWSPQTVFSLGVGRHHQAPEKVESFIDIGNPHLQSLRATHAVLGMAQKLDNGWSWRGEVYQKHFDNFVVNDAILNYRNGGSGYGRGAELLIRKEVSSRLSGFMSVSYSDAKRHNDTTGENFPFSFDQPLIMNVVGQYKVSDRMELGVRWSYHTGSPYTPIVGTGQYPDGRTRPIYGENNSSRVPTYHRLDLRLDYRTAGRFSFFAELINAYNHKNVSGYSYSADYKTREEVYQLPMIPSIGMEYKF